MAEGVEDAATLEALDRWGCDAAQGYFMSRPLPVGQMDAWLLDRAGSAVQPDRLDAGPSDDAARTTAVAHLLEHLG